jgi:hypothetical protein
LKRVGENLAADPAALFRRNSGGPYGEAHFAALKRQLDREEPDYAARESG